MQTNRLEVNVVEAQEADCYICRKHRAEVRAPGGPIYQDDLVFASHAAIPEGQQTTYLGAVLIEPKRHIPGLADLSDQEAGVVGLLIARVSRALALVSQAEHIYLFVLGHHSDHLHIWLVPRYPGTPREYWGLRVDEWPEAPRGDKQQIAAFVRVVQHRLSEIKA